MRSTWKRAVVMAAWAGAATTAVQAQDVPGDQELVRRAIHVCAACHGEGGVSHTKGVPSLAGQQRLYTIAPRFEDGRDYLDWQVIECRTVRHKL